MSNENKALMPINTKLSIEQKRNINRIKEGFERIGKIILSGGVSLAGVAISGPIGFTVSVVALANGLQEIRYKRTKDSMFITKSNLKGELSLWQDAWNLKNFSKLKGFTPAEKGATMGLEMLVGLERYKQQFADQNKNLKPVRDGEYGVYPRVFTTKTHGINIKTIEALEKLGYLQIESKEQKNKSILLAEKIGFKQYKDAKEAAIAKIKSDEEGLNKHQKQMYEIKLKLTDKPVNFEEIYKNYLEVRQTRGKDVNRKYIKRVGLILDVLKDRKIDLQRDKLGVVQIKYNSEESFAKRIEKEFNKIDKNKQFRESKKEEVEYELIQQQSKEQVEQFREEKYNQGERE